MIMRVKSTCGPCIGGVDMKKLFFLLIFLTIPGIMAIPVKRIDVIVFHSETCSSCLKVDQFLDEALVDYPTIIIQKFDIKSEEARRMYDLFKEVYALDIGGYPVPLVIIGKDAFSGSNPTTLHLMEEKLTGCFTGECTITIVDGKDIIVSDSTSTPIPQIPGSGWLSLFMVLAGIFCCLNPYAIRIAAKVREEKVHGLFFIAGYGITSLLLCFALTTVLAFFTGFDFLEKGVIGTAVGFGILSLFSVFIQSLRVPDSFHKSMTQLITDRSLLSLFCLGIGIIIASLLFTTGMYLLVVYRLIGFSFTQRLIYLLVFVGTQVAGLSVVYFLQAKPYIWLHLVVGTGSILLAVLFWMVW